MPAGLRIRNVWGGAGQFRLLHKPALPGHSGGNPRHVHQPGIATPGKCLRLINPCSVVQALMSVTCDNVCSPKNSISCQSGDISSFEQCSGGLSCVDTATMSSTGPSFGALSSWPDLMQPSAGTLLRSSIGCINIIDVAPSPEEVFRLRNNNKVCYPLLRQLHGLPVCQTRCLWAADRSPSNFTRPVC